MIVNNNYVLQEDLQKVQMKEIPKHPLRITGSRLGKVLNKSPFSTPFQQWCIMERFFKDYRETLEIQVGNFLEPVLRDYLRTLVEPYHYKVVDPKYCHNEHTFEYFPHHTIFGGKWDALL